MGVKMIVVDMDGTFLDQNNQYNQARFARVFQALQARQVKFVVASGSQYQRLQNQFDPYRQSLDFISQNGAIVNHGDDLLRVDALADDDLQALLALIAKGFPAGTIVQKTISGLAQTYVPRQASPETLAIIKQYYHAVTLVDHFDQLTGRSVNDQITKVGITFGPDVDYSQAVQQLRGSLPAGLMSQNSGFQTELIGNVGVDKVSCLRQLQTRYQIADDELMTFGDNENDLGMLTMTPWGFAMPNAYESIKKQSANIALADHNHDGILTTIEHYLKEGVIG